MRQIRHDNLHIRGGRSRAIGEEFAFPILIGVDRQIVESSSIENLPYKRGAKLKKGDLMLFSKSFIELHIIQGLPASNPNRGKDGDPKTVMFGGVLRTRLSSQAQKRSAREWYSEHSGLDRKQLADRSRLWHLDLASLLTWAPAHQRDAIARILISLFNNGPEKIFSGALSMNNLIFVSAHEIATIAKVSEHELVILCDLADRLEAYKIWEAAQKKKDKVDPDEPMVEVEEGTTKAKKKEKAVFAHHPTKSELRAIEKLIINELKQAIPGDVALFGRMMATLTEASIDGSLQVGHAFSVNQCHKSKGDAWHPGEIDFYTAIDDKSVTSGAAMIGEMSFTAPVHYRYANIAAHETERLMGDAEAAKKCIAAFIQGFVRSLPDGHSTQFAHATLPQFVLIQVKDTCPYGLSSAFLSPIDRPDQSFPTDGGGVSISQSAVAKLMDYRKEMAFMYGDTVKAYAIVALKDHHPEGQPLDAAVNLILEAL